MARRDFRQVAALAYDRMGAFELGIVSEVFGLSRPELDVDWYRFSVFSLDRRPLRATGGIRVEAPYGVGVLRTAGTIVMDDSTCMVWMAKNLMFFYKHESCGKCSPCREGTGWMLRLLERIEAGEARESDLDLLWKVTT